MRTLVISDLHLGNGGPYEAFAAEAELPAFLDRFASSPTRVFVNGDGVDFLMNEDPLVLDRARAAEQARAIVAAPASAGVFRAFGRVLAGGGEVVLRLGNHDLELLLPEVQEVIRGALEQPAEVAARLTFQLGDEPAILDVGGARVLLTHGEHNDKWNKVDYPRLLKDPEAYHYTAGSTLVKQLMNPLTREYGMRFMNFLKPDFQGGALTGLAVEPVMVKVLLQKASLDIGWQLFKRVGMATAFDSDSAQPDLGLADRLGEAGLTAEEQGEFEALLGDGAVAFAQDGEVSAVSIKLVRAALKAYAGFQRTLSGTVGDEYFRLEPHDAEWKDATRLAKEYAVGAVIIGHTHAARWKEAEGVVFANTGTWIWLMSLPRHDAGDDGWTEFLTELRHNPRLAQEKQKHATTMKRLTAVTLDAHPSGGAAMALVRWDGDKLVTLGESHVAPAARAAQA